MLMLARAEQMTTVANSLDYQTIERETSMTGHPRNNTKATISQGAVKTAIASPTTSARFESKCK